MPDSLAQWWAEFRPRWERQQKRRNGNVPIKGLCWYCAIRKVSQGNKTIHKNARKQGLCTKCYKEIT